MVPVHHLPTSQHLYVAFIDRVNYSALYAVEKMLECHTEPCLAGQSQVLTALNELRLRPCAVEVFLESFSDPADMAHTIATHYTSLDSADVRVSGFDGFIWARLLSPPEYTDILFQPSGNRSGIIDQAELRE